MKLLKKTFFIVTLWTLLAATSSRPTTRINPSPGPTSSAIRYDDAQLVEKAVMAGIRIIQASEVAQTKASNPGILQFAARLIEEHRSANQELMTLAAAANIPVPTDAYPDKREVMEAVNERAGPEYEKAYIRDMVKDHMKAVSLYKKGTSTADNKQLSSFFDRHLPGLQDQLDRARMFAGKH